MRILATLLRPTAGRARVLGHDVVAEPLAVRRRIGLAGQFAAVDAELTGRENVEMIARLYRLPGAEARRRASEVLERFGLAEAGDRRVSTYSLIVLLIGLVVGCRPSQPIYDVVLAFALVLAFAYVFSWISAFIGLTVRNPETAQSVGFVWGRPARVRLLGVRPHDRPAADLRPPLGPRFRRA